MLFQRDYIILLNLLKWSKGTLCLTSMHVNCGNKDNYGITHSTAQYIPVELLPNDCVKYSQKWNELCICGCTPSGLDKIEFLQSHENQEIYQKAFDLIEHYFGVEEEDASLAPQVNQSQGQFIFQQQEGPMEGFQL